MSTSEEQNPLLGVILEDLSENDVGPAEVGLSDPNVAPSEIHLLFERGLFLGAFPQPDGAQRMKDGREANGKTGIVMARYIMPPKITRLEKKDSRCEHELLESTKIWHENIGQMNPATCKSWGRVSINGRVYCPRHAGMVAMGILTGPDVVVEEDGVDLLKAAQESCPLA